MIHKMKEYVPGQIWLVEYPVHYSGLDFYSRMTIIRMPEGQLMLHSPCHIEPELKDSITAIGDVAFIVAPGSYHYFHVSSAQKEFPDAETHICPGIERKVPELEFDWILGDKAPDVWGDVFEQVLVRGTRYIWEVAFFHKPSRTLLLVDLVENIGDKTEGASFGLKLWWKVVFHMWNKPRPAPEYQMGWKDKAAARSALQRVLDWDIQRVVISHGDLLENDVDAALREAWSVPLGAKGT